MEYNISVKLDVKHVNTYKACRGCLSNDRILAPAEEYTDLFLHLLDERFRKMDHNGMLLCWECIALLRRVRVFQYRINNAQFIWKQTLWKMTPTLSSLSSLTTVHIDPVSTIKIESDYSSYDNDKSNDKEEKETIDKYNDYVKNEIVNSDNESAGFDNAHSEEIDYMDNKDILAVNESFHENIYKPPDKVPDRSDITRPVDVIDQTCDDNGQEDIKNEIKLDKDSTKKEKSKMRTKSYLEYAKESANDIDINDLGKYSSIVNLSVKDMEPIIEKESRRRLKSKKYKCKECKVGFMLLVDFQRHTTFKHDTQTDGPIACKACDTTLPSVDELESHWREHNSVYRCNFCSTYRSNQRCMNYHVRYHTSIFACIKCGDKVYSRQDFNRHYKAFHSMEYCCDHCRKRYTEKYKLKRHIQRRHLPPQCWRCDLRFPSRSALTKHIRRVHPRWRRELEDTVRRDLAYCVECDKQYDSVYRYRQHLRGAAAHTPKKKLSLPCPVCDKVFTRKVYLNNHYAQFHLQRSKHYCQICDKYYSNAFGLRTHKKFVHEGMKLAKTKICETCGMAFSTRAALTRHIRTHTGERPYRCAACPAAFSQQTPLKSHLRTQHKIF